jgi:hypothetical protein
MYFLKYPAEKIDTGMKTMPVTNMKREDRTSILTRSLPANGSSQSQTSNVVPRRSTFPLITRRRAEERKPVKERAIGPLRPESRPAAMVPDKQSAKKADNR